MKLELAEAVLQHGRGAPSYRAAMLLYLNKDTFLDAGGATAMTVRRALDLGLSVTMVHEQDPAAGGCPFDAFFKQTPQALQQDPYRLFSTLALPLHPSPEHRKISLRQVLRAMGAEPTDPKRAGTNQGSSKRLGSHMAFSGPTSPRRRQGTRRLSTTPTTAVAAPTATTTTDDVPATGNPPYHVPTPTSSKSPSSATKTTVHDFKGASLTERV